MRKLHSWAQATGRKLGTINSKLAAIFKPIAEQLTANEAKIVSELLAVQGKPVDIGGYYQPDQIKANEPTQPKGFPLKTNLLPMTLVVILSSMKTTTRTSPEKSQRPTQRSKTPVPKASSQKDLILPWGRKTALELVNALSSFPYKRLPKAVGAK